MAAFNPGQSPPPVRTPMRIRPHVSVREMERSPARGYVLVAAGAAMFALGGNLARYLLDDGVTALRLSQLRSAGSLVLLVWLRFHCRRVAPSLWGAVVLSISGCFLVVRAYQPGSLDGLGVLAAFG